MGKVRTKGGYEALRNARIAQNQSRLASLGILESVTKLGDSTPARSVRKYQRRTYHHTCPSRSDRLKGVSTQSVKQGKTSIVTPLIRKSLFKNDAKKAANATHLPIIKLSPDVLARRCDSKSRGSVYDPVLGLCCHFCRQKKLCGEEDCKRCGIGDIEQPCIGTFVGEIALKCSKTHTDQGVTANTGKTECSVCHSSQGVLCRACLKVRYGEEMDEVKANKNWMCPHCIEEKDVKPNWICNSSICLKKRKISATGVAIYEARKKGYKSVAHLLMDKLGIRLSNSN